MATDLKARLLAYAHAQHGTKATRWLYGDEFVRVDDAVAVLDGALADLGEALRVLAEHHGCTDHGCITHTHRGMGTNGGCECLKSLARGGVGSMFANRVGQVVRRAREAVGTP